MWMKFSNVKEVNAWNDLGSANEKPNTMNKGATKPINKRMYTGSAQRPPLERTKSSILVIKLCFFNWIVIVAPPYYSVTKMASSAFHPTLITEPVLYSPTSDLGNSRVISFLPHRSWN